MKNPFTHHPNSINESYLKHLKSALSFSCHLFAAALACAIHAFFPFLFENTAGKKIHRIVVFMKKTGRWDKIKKLCQEDIIK